MSKQTGRGMDEVHRIFPDGSYVRIRHEPDQGGEGRVAVQWVGPNGRPGHQPLWLPLKYAEEVLAAAAAFSRGLTT